MKRILILLVVGFVCTNARSLRPKKIKVIQLPSSCGCPFLESLGACKCQKDPYILKCGCQETYGVLNAELPSYGRISAINMPVTRCECNMPLARCDGLPAINLPDFSCSCQSPMTYQYVENTCGCRNGLLDYLSVETSVPAIIDPRYVQSQIVNIPSCGCKSTPCNCQNMPCNCQTKPCNCQTMPCNYQTKPCGCQNVPCYCQNVPCSCPKMSCNCQSKPCCCQSIPCCCSTMSCNCQTVPCSCPSVSCDCQSFKPSLDFPCGCQSCQMSPVYSCQSLPPPVIGCGGKHLRQITIQPPFI